MLRHATKTRRVNPFQNLLTRMSRSSRTPRNSNVPDPERESPVSIQLNPLQTPESGPLTATIKSQKHATKAVARKQIGKFMTTHRTRITSRYLAHVCNDANECMVFGQTEAARIRKFFDFMSFEYASPVKMLPSTSKNGRIGIIRYSRDGYSAVALFKIALSEYSDNLYYEYVVGQFVNKYLLNRFPLFTETYGLLTLPEKTYMALTRTREPPSLKGIPGAFDGRSMPTLSEMTTDATLVGQGCERSVQNGLVVQMFNSAISLTDLAKMKSDKGKNVVNIGATVLYQVYGPLAQVSDYFTHYDLHSGNILMVPTPKNTYVTMHYHLISGTILSFKTAYIAKIIDYGRCFFQSPTVPDESSAVMANTVCANTEMCEGECGDDNGFWFHETSQLPLQINSRKVNNSIDLIAATNYCMYAKLATKGARPESMHALVGLCKRINKRVSSKVENLISSPDTTRVINTVSDMAQVLANMVQNPTLAKIADDEFTQDAFYGDLHVYYDPTHTNPVQWIPRTADSP